MSSKGFAAHAQSAGNKNSSAGSKSGQAGAEAKGEASKK